MLDQEGAEGLEEYEVVVACPRGVLPVYIYIVEELRAEFPVELVYVCYGYPVLLVPPLHDARETGVVMVCGFAEQPVVEHLGDPVAVVVKGFGEVPVCLVRVALDPRVPAFLKPCGQLGAKLR